MLKRPKSLIIIAIRVQLAILDGFVEQFSTKDELGNLPSSMERVLEIRNSILRHISVLDLLTKQTNNLISQVGYIASVAMLAAHKSADLQYNGYP